MIDLILIGHGPIAGYVAERLRGRDGLRLAAVICRPGREAAARAAFDVADLAVATSAGELPALANPLALDCAGHAGLDGHGADLLAAGIDLVTLSVGALSDDALRDRLLAAAEAGGARLELAHGAVGGIDALAAARAGGLETVTYTARKPPAGWQGTPAADALDLDTLDAPAEHFRGSAREAARRYPKNANVAAMVALAGLGLDETTVSLVADPTVAGNRHEVTAAGAFGTLSLTIEGAPLPDNPKSSALAAMSLVHAVERRLARLVL